MFVQFNAYRNKNHENFIKKLNAQHFEKFEIFNIQVEKLRENYEFHIFIEPFNELFTLFPAEPITKPAFQLSELPFPQLLPEPFTPNVTCVAKEQRFGVHNRHRVVERIGLRSYPSPRASRSAFVHLGHLHPAATPRIQLLDLHYLCLYWPIGAFGLRLGLNRKQSLFRR